MGSAMNGTSQLKSSLSKYLDFVVVSENCFNPRILHMHLSYNNPLTPYLHIPYND
jgi:hypothetical protein